MNRRLLGRVAAVALTGAAIGVWRAPVSSGETGRATLEKAAWWSKGQPSGSPVPAPAPPNAPEGDLQVTGTPTGATSIAALRYSIDKGASAPQLKLLVEPTNGDLNGANAIIAACRAGSGWGPPAQEPGTWDGAPTVDCQTSAKGARSTDGTYYTFDLSKLMITDANGDSFVDVVLVPGTDPTLPDGANGSSFQLTFAKPSSSSVSTTSAASSTSTDFSASSSLAAGGVSVDQSGLVDPSTLGTPPISTSAPVFTPAVAPEQQQVTATAPAAQAASANNVVRPPSKPTGKPALAFFILLAAGAAGWWAQRQPIPSLHRLGPLASKPDTPVAAVVTPQVGGLGRFARPRTGPAPSL